MTKDLTPELRRLIMRIAAKERITFDAALEYALFEGFKIIVGHEKTQKTHCG